MAYYPSTLRIGKNTKKYAADSESNMESGEGGCRMVSIGRAVRIIMLALLSPAELGLGIAIARAKEAVLGISPPPAMVSAS